ncbi:DUF2510 domain-containing protein [Nocardioides litoris]|uniref:DUF2510 domain-containing protein n=1 Tax=Nocardioides litoris TaxID=1926648 RepID=UPI001477373D|nr:DUF2510 domain-containing protein [Nocardioides litoris]
MNATPPPDAGWFDDPTGRFGRRHWDGHRWTEHVVATNGETVTDPLPAGGAPLAPPRGTSGGPGTPGSSGSSGTPTPGWSPPPPQQPGPPAYDATSPVPQAAYPPPPTAGHPVAGSPGRSYGAGERGRPGWGLLAGGGGLAMMLLSLLVLPWYDGDDSRFTDISTAYRDAGQIAVGNDVVWLWAIGGAYAAVLVVAVAVAVAAVPLVHSSGVLTWVVILGGMAAGAGAAVQGWLLQQANVGEVQFSLGGWIGMLGLAVLGAGVVLGARWAPRPAAAPGMPRPPAPGPDGTTKVIAAASIGLGLLVGVVLSFTQPDLGTPGGDTPAGGGDGGSAAAVTTVG